MFATSQHRNPNKPSHNFRDSIGQQEDRVEQVLAAKRAAKQNGGNESEDKLADDGRTQYKPKGNEQRAPEFSVRKEPEVIAHPDKMRVGRSEADQGCIRQA